MDKVVKVSLNVKGDKIILSENLILPHWDEPYLTRAMVKGFEKIDGKKHNRRIYLAKLHEPYVFLPENALINFEYEYGYVYAWEKDSRKAKIALLTKFREDINLIRSKVEDFLDNASELVDSATNTMKYS